MLAFRDCVFSGVDTDTVVCFWQKDKKKALGTETMLLELRAGFQHQIPFDALSHTTRQKHSKPSCKTVTFDIRGGSVSDEDSFGDEAEDMPSAKEVLVDDEGFAYISDTILQSMKDEVSLVASDLNKYARRIDGRKLCPFCPFRSFTQLALLRTHIHKHHVSSKRYVCSGTKQIKVILALHDYVAANQTAEAEYLRRSAELLRFTVAPHLDCRHANIDRHIRLVLRASGPEHINCERVGQTPMLSLLPGAVRYWLPILEAIAYSPAMHSKMHFMYCMLENNDEWHYISIDATLKICMKLAGQASYRASKVERNAAPFGDEVAWRKILTVRGRSGAVLLMTPLKSEKSEDVIAAMRDNFTERQLAMVRFISSDMPSPKFLEDAKAICYGLGLAIVYEYANWSKKTSGSKKLRKLLSKANAVGKQYSPDSWGTPYTGELSNPLTPSEDDIRQSILDMSMPEGEAKAFFEGLDCTSPFAERIDFIRGISALCVLHPYEVKKKVTGPTKKCPRIATPICFLSAEHTRKRRYNDMQSIGREGEGQVVNRHRCGRACEVRVQGPDRPESPAQSASTSSRAASTSVPAVVLDATPPLAAAGAALPTHPLSLSSSRSHTPLPTPCSTPNQEPAAEPTSGGAVGINAERHSVAIEDKSLKTPSGELDDLSNIWMSSLPDWGRRRSMSLDGSRGTGGTSRSVSPEDPSRGPSMGDLQSSGRMARGSAASVSSGTARYPPESEGEICLFGMSDDEEEKMPSDEDDVERNVVASAIVEGGGGGAFATASTRIDVSKLGLADLESDQPGLSRRSSQASPRQRFSPLIAQLNPFQPPPSLDLPPGHAAAQSPPALDAAGPEEDGVSSGVAKADDVGLLVEQMGDLVCRLQQRQDLAIFSEETYPEELLRRLDHFREVAKGLAAN
ncbi:unnamed protein product [Symbiodinium microadriaticum]|nr:unnamed protein product [Symbiodinium microadriaticum]